MQKKVCGLSSSRELDYDAVPCNHGHSKIEAEFQLALQDALGLFQYVWY